MLENRLGKFLTDLKKDYEEGRMTKEEYVDSKRAIMNEKSYDLERGETRIKKPSVF